MAVVHPWPKPDNARCGFTLAGNPLEATSTGISPADHSWRGPLPPGPLPPTVEAIIAERLWCKLKCARFDVATVFLDDMVTLRMAWRINREKKEALFIPPSPGLSLLSYPSRRPSRILVKTVLLSMTGSSDSDKQSLEETRWKGSQRSKAGGGLKPRDVKRDVIVINKLAEQKVGLFPIITERKHKLQLPVEIIKSLTCNLNTNKWDDHGCCCGGNLIF